MTDPAPDPKAFVPRPFRPARWLPGAHGQTVAGRYLRERTGVHYRRERMETEDGDFVDLDWATVDGYELAATAPLVLLVHGLEGSAKSSYMLESCRALAQNGLRAVAMNFRSCSGEPNRALRFYHAGDTADLAAVLRHLRERVPDVPFGAMGFSLGANVLLKYLGERGDGSAVRAAVGISVPFDLMAGAEYMDSTFMGRRYTEVLLRSLRRKFAGRAAEIGDRCDAPRALASRSFRDFDDADTARLHGFQGVADYYGRSSSAQFLPSIRVPTLLVHAADDPFVPPHVIPRAAVEANPSLAAVFTEHGGHVGFIQGTPWAPEFWAEQEAARFLAERLP
ncbi:MAG: hydrolase, partial [Gemmatimonadetes bacterium]|nr:hydrolase [Gemmatimonadota bacterium]